MGEEQILTAEERLHKLIADGNSVLSKLKKTLSVIWMVGGGTVIVFFMSFVDVRSRMATLEESKLPKTEAEEKYALKSDVVWFMNNVQESNTNSFVFNATSNLEKNEKTYNKAVKQFMNDISRGVENQQ